MGIAATVGLWSAAASAQPLVYYGGRVISNVEVVQVGWSDKVNQALLQDVEGFYKALFASTYLDWLTEYDTIGKVGFADNMPGSEQHIGRGTFSGTFMITPANVKTQLDDSEIAAELAAQLASGALPPPKTDAKGNVNTLYILEMPPSISITLFSLQSCNQFGGYHFTISYKGQSVPYAVIPDCGFDFSFGTFARSHEIVEAITDMEPGLIKDINAPTARPVAWVAQAASFWEAAESADICVNESADLDGYTVATNWSNFVNGCVGFLAICDGSVPPPQCRPCNAFDDGVGCSGATPACATSGASMGQCVLCTAKSPGACTGATPACNEASNTCVGCLTSADCKEPAAPVCDVAKTTCRPCQADAECSSKHCDVAADAQKGQCVSCNADGDCAAEEHCDAHACVPDSSATTTGGSGGAGGAGAAGGAGGSGANGGSGGSTGKAGGCSCRTYGGSERPDATWLFAGRWSSPARGAEGVGR